MLEKIKQIISSFSPPDQDLVMAFQYKVPKSILVEVEKHGEFYTAKVEKINDEYLSTSTFMTEAETLPLLVTEVNDMLYTYLDFPENIKSRMPLLLPPEFAELQLQNAHSKELVFAK